MENRESPIPDLQTLRLEYEKAQDSAEHHDNLLWTVVGLIVGGMAALLGLAGRELQEPGGSRFKLIIPILGMVLSLSLILFVRSFASYRNQKYTRCKSIERLLGMKQHSGLRSPRPRQQHVVYVVAILFLVGWIVLLFGGFLCAGSRSLAW